ncbi:motility associated factor glycosyltransferase family protein [Aliiglaciecola aliphaticivorans]
MNIDYKEFNKATRCLHLVFDLSLDNFADGDFFEFRRNDTPDSVASNSWIEEFYIDSKIIKFNASIIMEVNADYKNYSIYHFSNTGELKYQQQLSEIVLPLAETSAGIIGVNESDNAEELELLFWSNDNQTKCQFGKSMETAQYKEVTDGKFVGKARTKLPLNRESLTLVPVSGSGQKFNRIKPFNDIHFPSSHFLKKLKDIHKGKSAWIVGNGPSVRTEDLNILKDKITFCFNRFYLAHEDTDLRATYTISGDEQMISDFGQEIVDNNPGRVFLANPVAPAVSGNYCWLRQISVFPSIFSFEPNYYVTPGGSSLYVAMQLAHYMGIKKLFIYGADFSFNFTRNLGETDAFRKASGDGNHFIKNYRSGKSWCPPSHRNIANSFYAAKLLFEHSGGGVFNATRGGILEIFERIAFEDALSEDGDR